MSEPRRINLALVAEVFGTTKPASAESIAGSDFASTCVDNHSALNDAAAAFATAILLNTPGCADQTSALRHIREALWTATAAVDLKGLV